MNRHVAFAPVFALAVACGSSNRDGGSEPDVLLDVPKPTNGVQLVSPKFNVPASSEVFYCMRIPFEVKETMHVQRSNAWQTNGGHHSMLYYLPADEPAREDPHECAGDEMGKQGLRFVGVGTADGGGDRPAPRRGPGDPRGDQAVHAIPLPQHVRQRGRRAGRDQPRADRRIGGPGSCGNVHGDRPQFREESPRTPV